MGADAARAAASSSDEMPYYERPDPKVPLTARVPRSVREGLEDTVRLWREMAMANGDVEMKDEIDITMVVTRLLRVGIEGAFTELGGRPAHDDEEAWSKLIKTIKANAKK